MPLPTSLLQPAHRPALRTAVAASALACALMSINAHAATDPLRPSGRWSVPTRGQAPLPPMGWNSWNAYLIALDEEKVMASAQAMVDTGLAKLGYVYVNIDDGWWAKRDLASGRMLVNTRVFPSAATAGGNSFRPFTERIRKMGLKPGLYTDLGYHSCSQAFTKDQSTLPQGSRAEREIGLEGRIAGDIAQYFSDWGFDYIKVDACGVTMFGADTERVKTRDYHPLGPLIDRSAPNRNKVAAVRGRYQAVADAIHQVRPANDYLFSICAWGDADVRSWGKDVGNLVRTSDDLMPQWGRMLHAFDSAARRPLYGHPGSWNDPDMLAIGHGDFDAAHLAEARTHFALWSIINAPLLLSFDFRNASPALLGIVGNAEVIALNQDGAGHPAVLAFDSDDAQVFVKTLGEGAQKGVVLLNRGGADITILLQAEHLKMDPAEPVTVRNLWTGESSSFTGSTSYTLKAHESLTLRASGTRALPDGLYLSELPGKINVAASGVTVAERDPFVHRAINPWEGSNSGGSRAVYTGFGDPQADATPYGQALQIDGKLFRSGLGVLANARLEVKNDAGHQRFTAIAGVDDSTRNTRDRVRFAVYGDGRLLAQSKAMRYGDPAQVLSASTAAVKVIELVTRKVGGASDLPLVASWGDAALLKIKQK